MTLDDAALARLRRLVRKSRKGFPMKELTSLSELPDETGLTIDFDAARELGHPLVVLRPKASSGLPDLSPREREVAALVAEGLSNKEIADRLSISVATVKDHVHHILVKTGLSNRTALAAALAK